MQVRVIDQTDELYDFIGDISMIDDKRKIFVYFDDVCATFVYDEHQLELVKEEK